MLERFCGEGSVCLEDETPIIPERLHEQGHTFCDNESTEGATRRLVYVN